MAYLNRLSDLLWAMARWQEGPEHVLSKKTAP
jgi:cob(I)alamin adenosyltransferase